MKRYWIAATILLLCAWPSGSNAYVAGQSTTAATPVQQAQPSGSTTIPQDSAKAQDPAAQAKTAATENAANPSLEAGQQSKNGYMLVELTRTLKARKLKPGDKIKAEVTQDVIAHGKVIIPVETELVGHITEVSVREGNTGESRLGLVFDRILLKHFRDINFKAVIQAVAPAVIRRSRVDEPSQMLPPSMLGGARSTGASSGGRGQFSRTQGAPGGSNTTNITTPMTVKQSPSGTAASGTAAAQLEVPQTGRPLSVGMPQGIRGMKGLSLTNIPSANTPGPVVVSNTDDVKLDSGTQILLRVVTIEKPTITGKLK